MKNQKIEFNHHFNYDENNPANFIDTGINTKFQPGLVLSTQEMAVRAMHGTISDSIIAMHYGKNEIDDPDMDAFSRADIIEQSDIIALRKSRLNIKKNEVLKIIDNRRAEIEEKKKQEAEKSKRIQEFLDKQAS